LALASARGRRALKAPARESFLPDLCGIGAQFTVVMVGELLAFVLSVVRAGFTEAALMELALLSLYIQWIGLSAAGVLCGSRRLLGHQGEAAEALIAYALVMTVALVIAEAAWWLCTPFGGNLSLLQIGHGELLARTLAVTAIVTAVVLRYFYVQHHWQERTAAAASAQLQALQARIRPHFLFNCMNTIASLTRSDPVTAERAIEDLSDLLRASLSNHQELVALADELQLVKRYLAIEALRLGPRLQVRWATDGLPAGVRLPPLSLQPLVENAIHHGIERLAGGGVIGIEATVHDRALQVTISNPLGRADGAPVSGHHLAQENLRQRLAARYGAAGNLRIEQTAHEYRATLIIPMESATHADRHR
jgi:two-component system sensor histidine kinase AlgZ